jgi:hypothetical protein
MYLVHDDAVYRNNDLDISGAWSAVYTEVQANARWPSGYTWHFNLLKPQIAVPGRVWLYAVTNQPAVPSKSYLIATNDFGTSWPLGYQVYQYCAAYFPEEYGATNLIPSAHNWQHVWLAGLASISVFGERSILRPIEGNSLHPSTLQRIGPQTVGYNSGTMHIPYADNADESRIYLINWGTTGGILYRADNGLWVPGTTKATTCNPANYRPVVTITPGFGYPGDNPKLFNSYTEDKDRIWFIAATKVCGVSDNAGATWTQKTSLPYGMKCASGFPSNSNYFFAGRTQTDWSVPSNQLIYMSDDAGATWQDKTGDLFTAIKAYMSGSGTFETGITTIAPEY